MNRKNIVFIFTDDQRYNTIHAWGNQDILTPNMDMLVEHGTSFTNAHIPGGTRPAICMPSRAMLHSGRTLFHLDDEGQKIPENHTCLGEALQANGYHCFGTGKWHNGREAFARSFNEGRTVFFGGMSDHWNVPIFDYDGKDDFIQVDNYRKHSTEILANTTVDFINNVGTDKPFFSYTAFLAPHDPRTMPQRFKEMYKPEDVKLPANYMSEHPFDFGVFQIRDEELATYPRNEQEIRKHIAEYYAMITHLDYEIGRIIQAVKDRGLYDDTIFILAGDNGLAVGCHALMGKQNHYEHSIRVPLIFSGNMFPQGKKVDKYVYLLDIYPTILELVEGELPESVEGKSFYKMFTEDTFVTRDTLYFAYTELIRAVKNERYKLIEYRNGIKATQLFDIIDDSDELCDLHENVEYQPIITELQNKMKEYCEKWDEMNSKYGKEFWAEF